MQPMPDLFDARAAAAGQGARLGFDLAQVSAVEASLQHFGERFARRLFTAGEIAYATSGCGVRSQRLAARFAAKEAVIKALGWSEAGVNWRDIEVVKQAGGQCTVCLHGRTAQLARRQGVRRILLSLSHDGDYAGAIAAAWMEVDGPEQHGGTPS